VVPWKNFEAHEEAVLPKKFVTELPVLLIMTALFCNKSALLVRHLHYYKF